MIFILYWTSQLIKDLTHMTISGTFATYYFFENQNTSFSTLLSLKRTLTTSIGSVCFGSLLVSIIRFIKFLVHQLIEQFENSFIQFRAS